MKEVIKKQLDNASKHKVGEKTQMIQMIGLKRPVIIKIWDCVVGMIFSAEYYAVMN